MENNENENIKFDIDDGYKRSRMLDCSDPEEYYNNKIYINTIAKSFAKIVANNDRFKYLSAVDMSTIKRGDIVCVRNTSITGVYMGEKDGKIEVKLNGENMVVDKSDVRPMDVYLSTLKIKDYEYLYTEIKKDFNLLDIDEIKYLNYFSEYFRISQKTVMNYIPIPDKIKIIKKLSKLVDIYDKGLVDKFYKDLYF